MAEVHLSPCNLNSRRNGFLQPAPATPYPSPAAEGGRQTCCLQGSLLRTKPLARARPGIQKVGGKTKIILKKTEKGWQGAHTQWHSNP